MFNHVKNFKKNLPIVGAAVVSVNGNKGRTNDGTNKNKQANNPEENNRIFFPDQAQFFRIWAIVHVNNKFDCVPGHFVNRIVIFHHVGA